MGRAVKTNSLEEAVRISFKPSSSAAGKASVSYESLSSEEIKYKVNFTRSTEISVGIDKDIMAVTVDLIRMKSMFKTIDD